MSGLRLLQHKRQLLPVLIWGCLLLLTLGAGVKYLLTRLEATPTDCPLMFVTYLRDPEKQKALDIRSCLSDIALERYDAEMATGVERVKVGIDATILGRGTGFAVIVLTSPDKKTQIPMLLQLDSDGKVRVAGGFGGLL